MKKIIQLIWECLIFKVLFVRLRLTNKQQGKN